MYVHSSDMKYQRMQCTTHIDKCMFDFYRNCCWLVRSCTLVARQEPMAVEIPVHPGPVRGPGWCQAALYPDAQNCPTPTPRSPDPGNENELLQQSFRSHHIPVQRTRYYKARVLTLHCLNVSYLHSEQANNELMSCICMMGNFLLSGCLAFLCVVAACHYRRGGGGYSNISWSLLDATVIETWQKFTSILYVTSTHWSVWENYSPSFKNYFWIMMQTKVEIEVKDVFQCLLW